MSLEDLTERENFPYTDLQFEPFKQTSQAREFDCGNESLNNFLTTEEVETYAKHRLGNTTLVYVSGQLVAYYTVGMSSLKFQYLKRVKQIGWPNELEVEAIPAMVLGRFAVRKDLQGKGLGRLLMNHLIALASEQEVPAV